MSINNTRMDQMLAPHEIARCFNEYDGRWAIVGGKALEVFFELSSWREHTDTDAMCPGVSGEVVAASLGGRGIDCYPFINSETVHETPTSPPDISPQSYAVKRTEQDFWLFELIVDRHTTESSWSARHNPEYTLPISDVIVEKKVKGIQVPVLAPEIVLAYKSLKNRPKDMVDLRTCMPRLDAAQQRRFEDIVNL